ncbi:hypothetical protein RFI_19706 [Reticulomyxa filosa]|uniref:GAF domain-containing protein n=1 Tax=Reticulomyxa filosa TaxID=46433 RepID=X6MUU4_RETFI|nr:hypothetical protein RFI_19706 [Reticulomyxa filosa]|eukprot:ETO17614.1 hypothetical protein RFI_19706 [Reticulomyxa filosa]
MVFVVKNYNNFLCVFVAQKRTQMFGKTLKEVSTKMISQYLCSARRKRERKQNQMLLRLMRAVITRSNIERLIEQARKVIQCDKVALFLKDEICSRLCCKASDDIKNVRLPSSVGLVGHVVTTGQMLFVEDAYKVPIYLFYFIFFFETHALIPQWISKLVITQRRCFCVPVYFQEEIIGALECVNKENDKMFTQEDETALVKVANEMSLSCSRSGKSGLYFLNKELSNGTDKQRWMQLHSIFDADDESSSQDIQSHSSVGTKQTRGILLYCENKKRNVHARIHYICTHIRTFFLLIDMN